ncbi:hypothetical protein N0B44_33090 [Roseibacterium beibuensis]|uniref:CC_3452 family protein n=1 Tax=[Roseibacterium] beibuensis TaxID=1193142 RepID=UPI00217D8ADF|nr:hypothetical protein [Roseibacterium beibuensis]MCS6627749.1 hypothetical protein [Roseibacterium beibuensis]
MLLISLISATLAVAQPAPVVDAAATLAAPGGEARRVVHDGRSWSCGPDGACVARGAGASQPVLRECRRFVARFGPVTRYERDGVALGEADLTRCNAAAA